MQVLLDTAYFPPIQYFAALSASAGQCFFLEACENYQKQSYRNRCHFYSASGLQSLSFPVVHGNGTVSLPITEIRIDYSRPWLQQHKRAIVSAYGTSAFFEYYRDELFDILDSRPETLWEMNLAIIRFFIDKIGIPVEIGQTSEFTLPSGLCGDGVWAGLPFSVRYGACDLRNVIHPKRQDDILRRLGKEKPYFQVFSCKYGFIPNLSIMDLLFNEGPDSISYLV